MQLPPKYGKRKTYLCIHRKLSGEKWTPTESLPDTPIINIHDGTGKKHPQKSPKEWIILRKKVKCCLRLAIILPFFYDE